MGERVVNLKDLENKVALADALLDDLIREHVPQSVKDAIAENYASSRVQFVEDLIPRIEESELEDRSQRVVPLAKANAILRDVENDLVKALTNSPDELFIQAVVRKAQTNLFLIAHAGTLVVLIVELIVRLGPKVLNVLPTTAESLLTMLSTLASFTDVPSPEDDALAREIIQEEKDELLKAWSREFGVEAWEIIEELAVLPAAGLLEDFVTVDSIALHMEGVRKVIDSAFEKARKAAFPQRPAKTVRRRRRQRS